MDFLRESHPFWYEAARYLLAGAWICLTAVAVYAFNVARFTGLDFIAAEDSWVWRAIRFVLLVHAFVVLFWLTGFGAVSAVDLLLPYP